MDIKFRDLKADEVECRVNMIKSTGLSLLLYKNARCDMNLLDETVGPMNWQRRHYEHKGNIYCGIAIWDDEKKQWVEKEDCGSESYTEKEKGEASDSFKRAGTNWGIGRELYTAPFIWVGAGDCKIEQDQKGKWATATRFFVNHIKCEKKIITELVIVNAKTGDVVFAHGVTPAETPAKASTKKSAQQFESIPEKLTEQQHNELMMMITQLAFYRGIEADSIIKDLETACKKKLDELTPKQAVGAKTQLAKMIAPFQKTA